jgi:queuine/archaeosine tRNA-ribosyltransferase
MHFDGDFLIRLSDGRDNFATGKILDGMFASRPTTVGLEMKYNIGSDLGAELDSHVGTRVKTGSDTLQKSMHVSYVRAKRAAEELVEGEAPSIEVHHVDEGGQR